MIDGMIDIRPGHQTVGAAFAQERDAQRAIAMMRSVTEAPIDYAMQEVRDEGGRLQMIILEATFDDPEVTDHLLTVLRGAHGIPMRIQPVAVAEAS